MMQTKIAVLCAAMMQGAYAYGNVPHARSTPIPWATRAFAHGKHVAVRAAVGGPRTPEEFREYQRQQEQEALQAKDPITMDGVMRVRERQRQRTFGVPQKEWAKSSDREVPDDAVEDHELRAPTKEQAEAANTLAEGMLRRHAPECFGEGVDELAALDRSSAPRDDWGYRRHRDKRYGYSGTPSEATTDEATLDTEPRRRSHDPKRHAIDTDMSFAEYLDKKKRGIPIERGGGEFDSEATRDVEPSAYADSESQSRDQLEEEVRRLRAELSEAREAMHRGEGAEEEHHTDAAPDGGQER